MNARMAEHPYLMVSSPLCGYKEWDLVTDIPKLAGDSGRKLEEIARSFFLFGDIIFDLKEVNIHVP